MISESACPTKGSSSSRGRANLRVWSWSSRGGSKSVGQVVVPWRQEQAMDWDVPPRNKSKVWARMFVPEAGTSLSWNIGHRFQLF